MNKLVFLLPPSERKVKGGTGVPLRNISDVSAKLHAMLLSHPNQQKLLGVKGNVLAQAIAANKALLFSPTLPAIERYSGVVFQGLDYLSLNVHEKQFIDERVHFVSAFFGLLAATDLIPEYKLKMSKLGAAKLWSQIISEQLTDTFVVDLLSKEYAQAVLYTHGVRIDFVYTKGANVKPAGHFGKLVKGEFVRWCAQHNALSLVKFKTFSEDGFSFNATLSTDELLIFSKSL